MERPPHHPQCPQNPGHLRPTCSHFSMGIYVEYCIPLFFHHHPHRPNSLTQLKECECGGWVAGGVLYGHSWDSHTLYTLVLMRKRHCLTLSYLIIMESHWPLSYIVTHTSTSCFCLSRSESLFLFNLIDPAL